MGDDKLSVGLAPYKEGDYTPFKNMPPPPKDYEKNVLSKCDGQMRAVHMLAEAGIL